MNEMRLNDRITSLRLALTKLSVMWEPTCPKWQDCEHPICQVPRIAKNALEADEEATTP